MKKTPDEIFECLRIVCDALDRRRLWHALAYGSLLGAVREKDVLAWDDDFDLFARPCDVPAILALDLSAEGISFAPVRRPATHLALNRRRIESFDSGAITVLRHGQKMGDFFVFTLFRDGVLRRHDFDREVYWSPHASFPAFFVESPGEGVLRGRRFPIIGHAEKWLEGVYGADWRVPIRSLNTGGKGRSGMNMYGHRCAPRLAGEIDWCVAQGWDRSRYAFEPVWPRDLAGCGPLGPVERTKANSRSLWWRDLDELITNF